MVQCYTFIEKSEEKIGEKKANGVIAFTARLGCKKLSNDGKSSEEEL